MRSSIQQNALNPVRDSARLFLVVTLAIVGIAAGYFGLIYLITR